jgi:hypothetical protein
VECTHSDASVNLLVTFLPKSTPNDFGVRLRAGQYSIIVDNVHVKQADRSGPTPVRERWTIELGPKEIDLMVNGKPVLRHAHGLTLTDEYRVELQGAAKLEAPAGARVRFDGVRIER